MKFIEFSVVFLDDLFPIRYRCSPNIFIAVDQLQHIGCRIHTAVGIGFTVFEPLALCAEHAYLPQLTMESRREKAAKITLRELYDKWEPTHDGTKSTMDCYRAAIKKFAPVWNLPVGEITVDDLQECMDDVPGKRTQQNMKTIIGILYKYAIPRHMAQLNMGQYLTVGGENGLGKDGLPLDVLETIRGCIGQVPYADYVVAQCYLGFRPSEFLALDVSSYDRKEKAFTGGAKTVNFGDRATSARTFSHTLTAKQPHRHGGQPHL